MTVPHHPGVDVQRPGQCLDGAQRIDFLNEADDGVDQYHANDDAGIHPTLQGYGHAGRDQQDVNQRMMKLGQKQHQGVLAPSRRQAIGPVPLLTLRCLFGCQSLFRFALQAMQDVVPGSGMEVRG